MVDQMADKVIEKMKGISIDSHGDGNGSKQQSTSANFVGNQGKGYQGRGKRGNFPNKSYRPRAGKGPQQ